MFIGTYAEVLVYDGETFQKVPVGAGKSVFSMDLAPDKTLWIGGVSELGYISPDSTGTLRFTSLIYLLPDSVKDFNIIWNTLRRDGKVYFNAFKYLFIYQPPGAKKEGEYLKVIKPEVKFYLMHNLSDGLVTMQKGKGLVKIAGLGSLVSAQPRAESSQPQTPYQVACLYKGKWHL